MKCFHGNKAAMKYFKTYIPCRMIFVWQNFTMPGGTMAKYLKQNSIFHISSCHMGMIFRGHTQNYVYLAFSIL